MLHQRLHLAPNAEPALNPYQPNHNKPAPTAVKIILAGLIATFP